MANALVIGMGGVGSVVGQKLHGYPAFERIFLGDVDTTYAQRLHERTKKSRFEVVPINAMDTPKLAAFLQEKKIAVTLNAATWLVNHSVLDACAQAGSHYLDMAADIYSPPGVKRPTKNSYEAEIEKFDARFREKESARPALHGLRPRRGECLCALGDGPARHRGEHPRARRRQRGREGLPLRRAVLAGDAFRGTRRGAVLREGRARDVSGKPLETEVEWHRFPPPLGLMKTYAVAHEEGVSLGLYKPFVEKGVRYSVFKYTLSDKVVSLAKSLALLDLDTWKKVKVDGVEVSPVRVACANLPKPATLGATADGYSCVGTEVRGSKDGKRVEYFIYTMDSHHETYERYGYSLTVVQTGIPPALAARLIVEGAIPERGVMMPEALAPDALMDNFSREGLKIFVEKREVFEK